MSKFVNPVELKISREDLAKILTAYMNDRIFKDAHEVVNLTMHIKGDHVVTMTVNPIFNEVAKDKTVAEIAKEVNKPKEDKKS